MRISFYAAKLQTNIAAKMDPALPDSFLFGRKVTEIGKEDLQIAGDKAKFRLK